jgi:hypothetical protein
MLFSSMKARRLTTLPKSKNNIYRRCRLEFAFQNWPCKISWNWLIDADWDELNTYKNSIDRVLGGSTTIYDVLLGGANHRSDGLFRPNPDSKLGQDANKALEFHTASVLREPKSTIRCWVYCSLRCTAWCRALLLDEVPESRFKACYAC